MQREGIIISQGGGVEKRVWKYAVARYVADILAPIVGRNGYAFKNSADLVKQLENCKCYEDDVLVSFDVTTLFTCVPVAGV